MAATGVVLQHAGVENIAGWWQSLSLCSVLCVAGSLLFLSSARGERIFGGDSETF